MFVLTGIFHLQELVMTFWVEVLKTEERLQNTFTVQKMETNARMLTLYVPTDSYETELKQKSVLSL